MKLHQAIDDYVAWRRAHGTEFCIGARRLRQFRNFLKDGIDCDEVTRDEIDGFLRGNGRVTPIRASKYSCLSGFYRYAISRGYISHSPLPARDGEPRCAAPLPPYVFSRNELHRLIEAAGHSQTDAMKLDSLTLRTLLLLLCGTGLRIGEALRLTMSDVDLGNRLLTVRDTKFCKSRLVPFSGWLSDALNDHARRRRQRPLPQSRQSTFFAGRDGTPLQYDNVWNAFQRLRVMTGILGDGDRRQPCLHSFRHTFAVERVTCWYQQGADVQRLLPTLATYLGHSDLNGTQVYLSMTPQLLQQASILFNQYVNGGDHE